MPRVTIFLLAAISLLPGCMLPDTMSGCLHSHQVTWKSPWPDTMEEILKRHVPSGTPVPEAKKFMESEGFSCTFHKNETFLEQGNWNEPRIEHKGLDFLECWRRQSPAFLMCQLWDIALVLRDDLVTDILI